MNKSLQHDDNMENDDGRSEEEIQIQLQFIKAKLLVHSGQFTHALSEYEDILEGMEREVERQTQQALKLAEQQQQQKQQQDGSEKLLSQQEDILNNSLPVIHGASALTGVGVKRGAFNKSLIWLFLLIQFTSFYYLSSIFLMPILLILMYAST